MREFDLIDHIRARTGLPRGDVDLGIGDDAALLRVPEGQSLAVCVDTMVAGVHFPAGTAPRELGWKSLAVNLSDLAAMGATPAFATLALTLPVADARWIGDFVDGWLALAQQHDVALVGGDTTRGPLSITVAAHGYVPHGQAMRRDGARVGDIVAVSGTLGDGAAGLDVVENRVSGESASWLCVRLNRPTPRVALGGALRGIATACIDVSDGLTADLGHLCKASGVGACIAMNDLPLSAALTDYIDLPTARGWQLSGGDDYELCFTVAPAHWPEAQARAAAAGVPVCAIGVIEAEPGVRVIRADGQCIPAMAKGWDHFA
ncbi:thiamine-phosphate kinase [Tahibacter amnicola]|uniref:Thiamine-monophosphate kinase n=1 Tax=Tahibacter amnicola TaxID=2976241 RepID=A0ABY6BCI9_9GAMM|nr:thiamine-phosphate kinase [Tahibacter amnicola]UXI67758.1 thiamine-phosphate kinase [Tahibacter amnicola]